MTDRPTSRHEASPSKSNTPPPAVGLLPAADLVQQHLLAWFAVAGRDLPWRRTRDPYAVLVSEMMLQQTGVERVLPKYAAWLVRFPTLQDLAAAPRAEVIRLWSGLGYNSRAVRLQEIARAAIEQHQGRLPATREALLSLPGIGPYTAGAVACFAYEQQVAFVDTNIRRVLSRVFLGSEEPPGGSSRTLQALADRALPPGRAWEWHQALMDLGATICSDAKPACLICPLREVCRSAYRAGRAVREASATYSARRKEGPWLGSTRYYRGRIVAALGDLPPDAQLTLPALAARLRPDSDPTDLDWLQQLVARLAADGLVALHDHGSERTVSLP